MVRKTVQDLVYLLSKVILHWWLHCHSQQGEWTEFTILLPKIDSKSTNKLNHELLAQKRLLYIGDNNQDVFELLKELIFFWLSLPNGKSIPSC